jgi:hypothetical protein
MVAESVVCGKTGEVEHISVSVRNVLQGEGNATPSAT